MTKKELLKRIEELYSNNKKTEAVYVYGKFLLISKKRKKGQKIFYYLEGK